VVGVVLVKTGYLSFSDIFFLKYEKKYAQIAELLTKAAPGRSRFNGRSLCCN